MSDIFDIDQMTEEDIKLQFITPALVSKWDIKKITMETSPLNKFTDGKVNIKGNVASRGKAKRCDYVLWYNKCTPLAIVEAKDHKHYDSAGLQQAIEYGTMMNVPFVYTSNGNNFYEHDFLTNLERVIPLEQFPTMEELFNRWKKVNPDSVIDESVEIADSNNSVNSVVKLNNYRVPLTYNEKLMNTPFYTGSGTYPPRYYQRNAVNSVLSAVSKGENRILLAMATGTGKTYTAFQIVWRLINSGFKKKVLYLADRNNLVDQSIDQDFSPLKDVIHKISFQKDDKTTISSYQVYFALYQQLDSPRRKNSEDEEDNSSEAIEREISKYKEFFSPDFFDFIIVDECHRGSASSDSRWRAILDYFSQASQLGMTATPKETAYVSNIGYFGEPVYSYSLKQGIEDGFLAPFKVINVHTNIDDNWRPEKDQKDIYGNEIEDRIYNLSDYDYNIIIQDRIREVAEEITKFLKETDRMSKTIVFCPTEAAADRMRIELNNLNADMVLKDKQGNVIEQYVVRITGSDKYGKSKLDYFRDVRSEYPVIATTSKLLSTGTDCKMVKLIVIDEIINSMTEFKQIIGRGTRLRYEDGKTHFTIMDFRRVSNLFADKEWDGEIEQSDDFGSKSDSLDDTGIDGTGILGGGSTIDDRDKPINPVPKVKPVVDSNGCKVYVTQRIVSVYDTDGRLLKNESIEDYTKHNILSTYQTLDNFVYTWNEEKDKKIIKQMLLEKGIDLDMIKKEQDMSDVDDFDFICHVAFNQKPLTRRERAENVRKRDVFGKYGETAREVINALLDKYVEIGVYDIQSTEILKQSPFTKYGRPSVIARLFGGNSQYWEAIREIEEQLYKTA